MKRPKHRNSIPSISLLVLSSSKPLRILMMHNALTPETVMIFSPPLDCFLATIWAELALSDLELFPESSPEETLCSTFGVTTYFPRRVIFPNFVAYHVVKGVCLTSLKSSSHMLSIFKTHLPALRNSQRWARKLWLMTVGPHIRLIIYFLVTFCQVGPQYKIDEERAG